MKPDPVFDCHPTPLPPIARPVGQGGGGDMSWQSMIGGLVSVKSITVMHHACWVSWSSTGQFLGNGLRAD